MSAQIRERVCILQPSYKDSTATYQEYDPPRDLSRLLPGAEVVHAYLAKATAYRQLKQLKREGFDIFVNLCESYLDWDTPSVDVIHSLLDLGLPFTGATPELYDPSKELMKFVAWYAGVATPEFAVIDNAADAVQAAQTLGFPVFVKPNRGGDSLGVDAASLCRTAAELHRKVTSLIGEFDSVILDKYIEGREFSVLVAAPTDPRDEPLTFRAIEFVFPPGELFKTYDLKITQFHPECNIPCQDENLDRHLREAASRIFIQFNGAGYCRMDFRVGKDGVPYFLDANFACSIFYGDGFYGTADYILQHDGFGQQRFLRHIIDEGKARFQRSQRAYRVRRNAISGYGICASRAIRAGEIVFHGEERAQRIVTRRHVTATWKAQDIEVFRRYAYPMSAETFVLWDREPSSWAPQNHSCSPNTAYAGLDVVALRDIAHGEELTLDYERFCNENMEPFECSCGSPACRGFIHGTPGNSVDFRERNL